MKTMDIPRVGQKYLTRIKEDPKACIVTTLKQSGEDYGLGRVYAKCNQPGWGNSFWRGGTYRGKNCRVTS